MIKSDTKELRCYVIIDNIDCKGVNVVELVKHILNKKCEDVQIKKTDDGHFIVTAEFEDKLRDKLMGMKFIVEYDNTTIYEVKLSVYQCEDDLTDYTMDTKLYYYENLDIYRAIQEIRDENDTPKTVRIYKLMYNSYPIEGAYSFNVNGRPKVPCQLSGRFRGRSIFSPFF